MASYVLFWFDNSVRLAFSIPGTFLVDQDLLVSCSLALAPLCSLSLYPDHPSASHYSASHLPHLSPRPLHLVGWLVGLTFLLVSLSFLSCIGPLVICLESNQ